MNYDSAIDHIRDQRLEMVQNLCELKRKLIETLGNLTTFQAIQELSPILANYCSVKENIHAMIADMNTLEDEMTQANQVRYHPTHLSVRQ